MEGLTSAQHLSRKLGAAAVRGEPDRVAFQVGYQLGNRLGEAVVFQCRTGISALNEQKGASMSGGIVFVNGKFVPANEASVSVFDHGFLYGDGIFDTAVAWNGRVFKLEKHLDRLWNGLLYAHLEPPYARDELRELILETLRRNELRTAYVKVVVTRGTTERPLLDVTGAQPGCVIFAQPYLSINDPERVREGVSLKVTALRRVPTQAIEPRIKSLNFLNLVLARIEARAAGADNGLCLDMNGHVCEGAGFNIFAARGGRLLTPAGGVLQGITRATVLEIASKSGIPTEETTLELFDLYTADEVFMSSTAGGIMPVTEVDGRGIGDGVPGSIYKEIAKGYVRMLESPEHGTPIHPEGAVHQPRPAGAVAG
jgi:branched-chain amino acid aminotransferase